MIAAIAIVLAAGAPQAAMPDPFATLAGWQAAASDGVAARMEAVPGAAGEGLRLTYDFAQVSGYAYAARALPIGWPANYALTLRMRGNGGVNDLQVKFVDASGRNVWWFQRKDVRPTADWQTLRLRPRDLQFAWGPIADKTLRRTARIEVVVVRGRDGGRGHLDVGGLTFTPLPPPAPLPPIRASDPAVLDGRRDTAWHGRAGEAITLDFGGGRDLGGLLLRWVGAAPRYLVEASDDGRGWRTLRTVVDGDGSDDPLALPDTETRYLRVRLPKDAPAASLAEVEVEPLAWAATPNAFVESLAKLAPRGTFPRGFSGEQPYWTLVGTDGGTQSGLLGEDGAVEVARGGYSIEPFVIAGGRRFGWAEVAATQSLEQRYLPIPHVVWDRPGWRLDTSLMADVTAPRLIARYRLTNTGPARATLRLVLAVRPFQVNPPAQFLGQPGGVSPIDAIAWTGGQLTVNSRPPIAGDAAIVHRVVPTFAPTSVATAPFVQGGLARPEAPAGGARVVDPDGLASAALGYDLDLAPGETADLPVALPFDGEGRPLTLAAADAAHAATVARWQGTLGRVTISVPPAKQAIADTVRTALADVLMSRQGPALQPGTRAYDRSWIRDGAMMADTLLRLGVDQPVAAFADWYSRHLFASGKVPCCVDRRGPDPVPEDDAQGEYIHLLVQLYRYTGDRARLAAAWPRLDAAWRYMEAQRASERTAANTAPERRMLYGLMPPSISHEGYSAQPQYSLWDDFWALAGYKDAAFAAAALDRPDAPAIAAARDQFAGDLHAAIAASVRHWRIDYIPGATSLGEFDATSTTVALDPAMDRAALDPALLAHTFERQWRRVIGRTAPGADWRDYTPYEWRNVSAMLRLGWGERANQLADAYMADRRPLAWNGWAEVVGRDPREIRFIGDMPHAWVASDFVRAALDLFAYDGGDGTLVLGAGLTREWLTGGGAAIRGLRTPYGLLDLSIRTVDGRVEVTIGGNARPPHGFVLASPLLARQRIAAPTTAEGRVGIRRYRLRLEVPSRPAGDR